MSAPATFHFALCNEGVERWLSADQTARTPQLRLAYSEPGFVTFTSRETHSAGPSPPSRADDGDVDESARSPFALAMGRSLGKATEEAVRGAWGALPAERRAAAVIAAVPRDDDGLRARVAEAERLLERVLGERPSLTREVGTHLLEVIVGRGDSWMGVRRARSIADARPGARLAVPLPAAAPSRAYLKAEEAALRFGLPLAKGQTVVELGSAPGGASYALLQRGLHVIGVDPGEMDPRVLAFDGSTGARFTHLRASAGALKRGDVPRALDWVFADMNLAPEITLRYAERVIGPAKKHLKGCVITLKLGSDDAARKLDAYVARVRTFGFSDVVARQLEANRREVCVVGRR